MIQKLTTRVLFVLGISVLLILGSATAGSGQKKAAKLDQSVDTALAKLLDSNKAAKELSKVARGILVFPSIKKAGFVIGGQYGEGALRIGGKTAGYYTTAAGSFGLQAGGQKFGYAMFFMTPKAVEYLQSSKGWEVGVGPNITVVDEGFARSLTTSTARDDIYAFFFSQKGLMGGLGLQGSKITKFDPDK